MSKNKKQNKDEKLIALCMIVKNEEKWIEKCIDSAIHLVDEIVIVDTGSTDRTLDILKLDKYKDKMNIYHHAWENNFSKARNQSLSYVKATWAFTMDADEELFLQGSIDKIRESFKSIGKDTNAIGLKIKNYDHTNMMFMEHSSVKIFRRGTTHYVRRVHNQPIFNGKVALVDFLFLKHYGFDRTPQGELKKAKERIIPLLLESIKDDPKDYQSYFYLGQAYSTINEVDNAIKYNELYISKYDELKKQKAGFSPSAYYTLIKNYIGINDMNKANKVLVDGLTNFPKYMDLHYLSVEIGAKIGNPKLVELGAEEYIKLFNEKNKERVSMSGEFIFSNSIEGVTFVLRILSVIQIKQGLNNLINLGKLLPKLNEEKRFTIKNTLKDNLKEIPSALDFFNKGIAQSTGII